MKKKKLLITVGLLLIICAAVFIKLSPKRPASQLAPAPWMQKQIESELSFFKNKKISLQEMRAHFYPQVTYRMLVEVQIKDNKTRVITDPEIKNSWVYSRYDMFNLALKTLKSKFPLPDVTFFVCLWDHYEQSSPFPVLVFAKNKAYTGQIQIPDCHAIQRSFHIAKGQLFTDVFPVSWDSKINKLAWRGSTSQGIQLDKANFQTISRLHLCQLSQAYPHLIDAGFTLMYQGGDTIPELQPLKKEFMSWSELVKYKYQIWIDGNSASYSDSGWRFFSNSVVLKPHSENTQWYYQELEPGIHYVPVERNLEDLPEKIQFLQNNDKYAEEISKNALQFANEHLSQDALMRYLYALIWEYSKLEFVD
jgi:hypothetical protein